MRIMNSPSTVVQELTEHNEKCYEQINSYEDTVEHEGIEYPCTVRVFEKKPKDRATAMQLAQTAAKIKDIVRQINELGWR